MLFALSMFLFSSVLLQSGKAPEWALAFGGGGPNRLGSQAPEIS